MQMIPEAIVATLSCARIGAVHSVVFGAFSSDALKNRINDSECKLLITQDNGVRGLKFDIPMKENADKIADDCPSLTTVVMVERSGNDMYMKEGKLNVEKMNRGMTWLDTGTIESLHEASSYIRTLENRQGLKISCPEEISIRKKWILPDDLLKKINITFFLQLIKFNLYSTSLIWVYLSFHFLLLVHQYD